MKKKIFFVVEGLAMKSDSIAFDCIFEYRALRQALDEREFDVRIFARHFDEAIHQDIPVEPIQTLYSLMNSALDALVIYHFCDGWEEFETRIAACACQLVLRWHNNTPPWFFPPYSTQYASRSIDAFGRIMKLARRGGVRFWCNSAYTAEQLSVLCGADVARSVVYPATPFLESDAEERQRDPSPDASPMLLFVSRVTPHKGHKTVLMVASKVQEVLGRKVQVAFPGRTDGTTYDDDLKAMARQLDIDLTLPGEVDWAELRRLYAEASVFCCFSEHEGFGLPVYEAARLGVPVVGWANTAVAESLAGHPLASDRHDIRAFAAACVAALEPTVAARVVEWQRRHMLPGYTKATLLHQMAEALRSSSIRLPDHVNVPAVMPERDGAQEAGDIAKAVRDIATSIKPDSPESIRVPREIDRNFVTAYDMELYGNLLDQRNAAQFARSLHIHPKSFMYTSLVSREENSAICRIEAQRATIVYGPYIRLPHGSFTGVFEFGLVDVEAEPGAYLYCDFGAPRIAEKKIRYRVAGNRDSVRITMPFRNNSEERFLEFRMHANGKFKGTLIFRGVSLHAAPSLREFARYFRALLWPIRQ